MSRRVRVLLCVALLLWSGTGVVAANGAGAPGSANGSAVVLTYDVQRIADRPGLVRVTATVHLPDPVTSFRATLPDTAASVTAIEGFRPTDADTYAWNESTATPALAYRVRVNRTNDEFGGYDAVDVGEWAFLSVDRANLDAVWRSRVDLAWKERLADPEHGVAGSALVLLSPDVTVRRFRADGQTLRLIYRAEDPPESSVSAIGSTLESAARRLQVGGTDERVNVFAPPDPIRSGGLAIGTSNSTVQDVWVHRNAAVGSTGNTWIHEYVHTRQHFSLATGDDGRDMAWFTEASAGYYESLLSYYQGLTRFGAGSWHLGFYDQISDAGDMQDAVLSAPDTWSDSHVPYAKGALVLAALDAKIRNVTDRRRSLQHVFARMNAHPGTVTVTDFRAIVSDVAGRSLDAWLTRYVTTNASPSVPRNASLFAPLGLRGDRDGDELSDVRERVLPTAIDGADTDGDGLSDAREVGTATNATLADTDGDGLADGREVGNATAATVADTDADGLPDGREFAVGANATRADTDGDGLEDGREVAVGTASTLADTDDDGLDDAREVSGETDPRRTDTDGDGLADGRELERQTNPVLADTDGDGLADGWERANATSAVAADTDGDGLDDEAEVRVLRTDPTARDTDGDGVTDGVERERGTDPLSPNTPTSTPTPTADTPATPAASPTATASIVTRTGSPSIGTPPTENAETGAVEPSESGAVTPTPGQSGFGVASAVLAVSLLLLRRRS